MGRCTFVDMYRAVIEHPQFMPAELKTRRDLTDGNDRGRIYRIVPKSDKLPNRRNRHGTSPDFVGEELGEVVGSPQRLASGDGLRG